MENTTKNTDDREFEDFVYDDFSNSKSSSFYGVSTKSYRVNNKSFNEKEFIKIKAYNFLIATLKQTNLPESDQEVLLGKIYEEFLKDVEENNFVNLSINTALAYIRTRAHWRIPQYIDQKQRKSPMDIAMDYTCQQEQSKQSNNFELKELQELKQEVLTQLKTEGLLQLYELLQEKTATQVADELNLTLSTVYNKIKKMRKIPILQTYLVMVKNLERENIINVKQELIQLNKILKRNKINRKELGGYINTIQDKIRYLPTNKIRLLANRSHKDGIASAYLKQVLSYMDNKE